MNKKSVITQLFLLLLIMLFSMGNSVIPSDLQNRIDAVVEPLINPVSGSVGIAVGVISKGGTQSFGYGETVLGSGIKPDGDTIFEIGSITKPFTALLLADMVEDDLLMIDDPVENFLPDTVSVPEFDGRKINLEDLATHTSGLPRLPTNIYPADPWNPYADYTSELLYEFLSSYSLPREPGELFEYSNVGMGLLGHALELATETDYEDLLINRICNQLEMDDTRINLTAEQEQRFAQGYFIGTPVPHWDFDVLAPCGAIRSTVSNMLTFLSANLGLTETDLSQAIESTHIVRYPTDILGDSIGLGWHILDYEDIEVIWHNGATFGFSGVTAFIKENGTGVVLLSNSYPNPLELAGDQILAILEDYKESRDWALAVLNDAIDLENDVKENIMDQDINELKQNLRDSIDKLTYVRKKIREARKNGELDGIPKKDVIKAQLSLKSAIILDKVAIKTLKQDNLTRRKKAKFLIEKAIFLKEWVKNVLEETTVI